MKKKPVIYIIWAVWYLTCLFLSLGATPQGFAKAAFVMTGLAFYVPAYYLLYLSKKDAKHIKVVQYISVGSLVAFVVLFVLNVLSVKWSDGAGRILDILFKVFCAPITCMQYWVVGLFMWAGLLRICGLMLKKLNQNRPDQK